MPKRSPCAAHGELWRQEMTMVGHRDSSAPALLLSSREAAQGEHSLLLLIQENAVVKEGFLPGASWESGRCPCSGGWTGWSLGFLPTQPILGFYKPRLRSYIKCAITFKWWLILPSSQSFYFSFPADQKLCKQNHRMVWVERDPENHPDPTPCHKQGTSH